MTHAEIRLLLATVDAGALRLRCGISAVTIARALGVSRSAISRWERRETLPFGFHPAAERYARVIAALDDHHAITIQLDRQETARA